MSHRRSSSSSRHHHRHPQSLPEPPPYILDFTAQTCRPRSMTSVEKIRAELTTPNRPGWQRVLVLRGLGGDIGSVIGKTGTQGSKWTFLDMQRTGPDGELEEKFCHAELWMRGDLHVLLLDGLPTYTLPCPRHPPHRRRSSSKTPRLSDFAYATPQKSVLEEKLWETLGDCRPLEEVVASVVYSSWMKLIQGLGPATQNGQRLWRYLQALESNMDASAIASVGITPAQWASLLNRLHQRIHLSLLLQGSSTGSPKDKSSQSLNRIAYLGGLLLPLTVVSGILSIEGTYGPEGSAFWVFWLAAGLSSLVALLVIHADHLRTLDVWMEEEIFEPHGHAAGRQGRSNIDDVETGFGVQTTEGGIKRKKWKRTELGWGGAVKKMTGWYRWKGSPGMEWRMPDEWEERVNRRMGW